MKIISKFKDYYDIGFSRDTDDLICFDRKTREIPIKTINKKTDNEELFAQKAVAYLAHELPGIKLNSKDITIDCFVVFFCGKIYPGVRITDDRLMNREGNFKPECFYDLPSVEKFLTDNNIKFNKNKDENRWLFRQASSRRNKDDNLFDFKGSTLFEDECIKQKIAIAVCRTNYHNSEFIINPELKSLDFFKSLDPWQANQELSMFLGGVLSPESKPMIKIEDKYKVLEHGFDHYSFKKEPGKKIKTKKL